MTTGTVLASGSASAAKFFVAALAFTGAYVGLSAYGTANSAPAPAPAVSQPVRELPLSTTTTAAAATQETATAGQIGISALATGPNCLKTFVARSLIVNPAPDEAVSYNWRLSRWNPGTNTWHTYLVDYSGFAGAEESAEWDPAIAANPGWYRVELRAEGLKTVKSDRFQVSC
ncbi:hypothetical protein [Nonomuraea sp. LPB2021202275-12-8]|uniref:hypothetical protein n=1 Tax=Nonomuraea sp. LPB2021202275-12-8 TaxID=3120159 RepID=UPI00300D7E6B